MRAINEEADPGSNRDDNLFAERELQGQLARMQDIDVQQRSPSHVGKSVTDRMPRSVGRPNPPLKVAESAQVECVVHAGLTPVMGVTGVRPLMPPAAGSGR